MTSTSLEILEREKALLTQRMIFSNLSQARVLELEIEKVDKQIERRKMDNDLLTGEYNLQKLADKYGTATVHKCYTEKELTALSEKYGAAEEAAN